VRCRRACADRPCAQLSGSEQNPDITGKSIWLLLQRILGKQGPVHAFMEHGHDFVVEHDLPALVAGMNKLAAERDGPALDLESVTRIIEARDAQIANGYTKDAQCMVINTARSFVGERYTRVAKAHRLLDPAHGPLIAVRMNIVRAAAAASPARLHDLLCYGRSSRARHSAGSRRT
jgi:predicted oxidoreductase